jgi:hypothetical protein
VKWVQGDAGTTNVLYGVAYGNGQFVAVGGHVGDWLTSSALDVGSIITSADGVNWVLSGITNGLRRIALGNGQFVAVGDGGTTLTSPDGMTWTRRKLSPWDLGLNDIAYGNGRFFVVRGGTILESGSIISMSMTRSANPELLSLSVSGPIGLIYTVQTSSDLTIWQDFTNIIGAQPTNVVFDNRPAGSGHMFFRAFVP